MTLHYHGTPITPNAVMHQLAGACFCVSHARPDQIDVLVHPQSIIHSMVQYRDMSVVAQLGTPDMRVPIAYGLSWPERMASGAQALDFHALSAMTFEALDDHGHPERFAGIHLAWDALRGPAGTTAVLNAAIDRMESIVSKFNSSAQEMQMKIP